MQSINEVAHMVFQELMICSAAYPYMLSWGCFATHTVAYSLRREHHWRGGVTSRHDMKNVITGLG